MKLVQKMIIPLNKSSRAKSLWQKTGEILGLTGQKGRLENTVSQMKGSSSNQSSGVATNLNYAPNIQGGDEATIKQTLKSDRQN
ncbi:hypothetical protein KHA80_14455 [Anaerobacillus sp. HL2]|nr:hypothetical protein KHA80_14455 [Anaerobacillus sp. HL2]